MAGKQAKILSQREIRQVIHHIKNERYPLRDRIIFLLSIKARLRAKEISLLTWGMVTDTSGRVGDALHLLNNSSKGKSGRTIPLNSQLKEAFCDLYNSYPQISNQNIYIVFSTKMIPCIISHWFKKIFKSLRVF